MRISALSRASGVPVATIKYYLREGLLAPGIPTARNQADYGEEHLHRLRLIRVLMEVGGLGVAAVRAVLEAIDDDRLSAHQLLGVAHTALGPRTDDEPAPDDVRAARADVAAFLTELGWQVRADAPAARALADVLAAHRRLRGRLGRTPTPRASPPLRPALGLGMHALGGRAMVPHPRHAKSPTSPLLRGGVWRWWFTDRRWIGRRGGGCRRR